MQKISVRNAQTITVAGGKDYNDLENKPSINSVELEGNKTLHELGIQQEGSYATTSDLATKQDKITSSNKLSSDLVSGLSTVATSGSYNDLLNQPTIPDVSDFITKDVNDLTYYELKTAVGNSIVMSIDSSTYVLTVSLKNSAGTILNTQTVDLPLETMVVGGSYDSTNKKIILTLKNGQTIEFSVADLVSGLQSEITSNNKLSADLVDDTSTTNKFVSASDKTTWNAKVGTTDYATSSVGGVIKARANGNFGVNNDGIPYAENRTYAQYQTQSNDVFIGKGTLENVIAGKELVDSTDLATKQDTIQYSTMPTANASTVGKIVQYTGTTDSTYTNGYFYIGTESGGSYSWTNLPVQASGGSIVYDYNISNTIEMDDLKNGTMYLVMGSRGYGKDLTFKTTSNNKSTKYYDYKDTFYYFCVQHYGEHIYEVLYTGYPLIVILNINSNGKMMTNTIWEVSGNLQLMAGGNTGFSMMNEGNQTFTGVKTFNSFPITPSSAPTTDYQTANKKYVDDKPTTYAGYDATKTQVLKNINGTLTWVDES